MRALLLVAALALAVSAQSVVYYRRAIDVPPGYACRVYTAHTLCQLAEGQALPAPNPDAVSDAETPVAAMGDVQPLAARARDVALSWGQDRVDQRSLPLSGTYTPDRTGHSVTLFVVATGVDETIPELASASNPYAVELPATDCNGFGTRVAVTATGQTYGIASLAVVQGIKVTGCGSDTTTGRLADGLAYVLDNLNARNVVLIPYAYIGRNGAVESVIADLLEADATVIAPAGDGATNACNFFPGAQAGVFSLGMTTRSDHRDTFSNYGSCVTMFAPGAGVTTEGLGGVPVNVTGTAYAAAEAAGAAAMVLQGNPSFTCADVVDNLAGRATEGVVHDARSTPNLLLFVLQSSDPPQPTTTTTSSTSSSGAGALAVGALVLLGFLV